MQTEVFLDAAYAIALSAPNDLYHERALLLADRLEAEETRTENLYAQALELYRQRPDKEWGLTDCFSFIVMQARRIAEALTTDEHFQQSGFQALLLNEA